jgi:hypothetical protein
MIATDDCDDRRVMGADPAALNYEWLGCGVILNFIASVCSKVFLIDFDLFSHRPLGEFQLVFRAVVCRGFG